MNRESRNLKYPALFLVGAGVFLSTMDSSMVNVALPFIMGKFGTTLLKTQWVVLIYLLSITVTLLFWGIVADYWGRYRTYFTGIGVFVAASIGCSIAPSLFSLIVLRFVEGLGAAMMMAAGPTIIRDVFPRNQLGTGLGLVGIATSAGLMSGPVVGGFLISLFSWRMIFLVSVPVGLLIITLGLFNRNRRPCTQTVPKQFFDWKGAVMWALLITSLVLYGNFLPAFSLFWKLAGGAWLGIVTILFYFAEKTRKSNILPLHLFPKSYYHIGLITSSLSFASLFGVLVLMPFYLTYVKGLGAEMVGSVMMAVPLTLFIVSPTAGMLYDRMGSRYLTTLGLGICTVSLLCLAVVDEHTRLPVIFAVLALLGMGQSMFLAPNTASLLSKIPEDDAGITSGLLATSRNLGMLMGAASVSMVFSAWYGYFSSGGELANYSALMDSVFISSLRATMLCIAALSFCNVCISWQRQN